MNIVLLGILNQKLQLEMKWNHILFSKRSIYKEDFDGKRKYTK